jgi:hypothetical protein
MNHTLKDVSPRNLGEFANELGEFWEDLAWSLDFRPRDIKNSAPPNSPVKVLCQTFVDALALSGITLRDLKATLTEKKMGGLIPYLQVDNSMEGHRKLATEMETSDKEAKKRKSPSDRDPKKPKIEK